MKRVAQFGLLIVLVVSALTAIAQSKPASAGKPLPKITNLMYLVNSPASIKSFQQNADQISIIAPQCFKMEAEGFIGGEVPPAVLETAAKHRVAVMPLVTQRGFDQPLMHSVLDDPAARKRAIRYLVYFALRDGYLGIQFDYENIHYTYRDKFTTFFKETAAEFHRHGLLLSIAVVGKYSDDRNSESPGGFDNWSGVYDYAKIAQHADFVSIMAYPQHAGFSEPGPIAGYPWVEKIVDYTMSHAPARKISLGVPLYGHRWTALMPGQTAQPVAFVQDNAGPKTKRWKTTTTSYPGLAELTQRYPATWDEQERGNTFTFTEDNTTSVVWFENARSLKYKLDLTAAKRLDGISAWVIGQEDPEFWTMLQQSYSVRHPKCGLIAKPYAERARMAAQKLQRR